MFVSEQYISTFIGIRHSIYKYILLIKQLINSITNLQNIKGYYTPNQKLTCFMLYLKIINTVNGDISARWIFRDLQILN